MKKIRFILLSILTLISVNTIFAQVHNPVKWDFTTKKVNSNEYLVTFTANIEGDWHMYGLDLPEGGPIATSFTFDASDDYELLGDIKVITKPEIKFDNSFQIATFWEKGCVFSESQNPYKISCRN